MKIANKEKEISEKYTSMNRVKEELDKLNKDLGILTLDNEAHMKAAEEKIEILKQKSNFSSFYAYYRI